MQPFRLSSFEPLGWPAPAVTIGNFDGVHRGHQALVAAVLAAARSRSGTSVVLTFDPHPARVLHPSRAPAALMTLVQRARLLAEAGVERVAVLPFTHELAHESPEEFARLVLSRALQARVVVVGCDFRFGRGRAGDAALLARLGRGLGFEVEAQEPVLHGGAPVSSTRVRQALGHGAVEEARALLGRNFFVEGRVVAGAGRGRRLGIPTANLEPESEALPRTGVYAGWCRLADEPDEPRPAVVNLGRRPTFDERSVRLEAHLLDFAGDLYGRRLRIEFVQRLREEKRFSGPEALLDQIRADVARARPLLLKP